MTDTRSHTARKPSPIETVKDSAQDAVRRTSEGIESNPLSVLVGGVALGVLAGALIPKSRRETELLGPVGRRITDGASAAARAARDAGKAELDGLGISKGAAKDQVRTLLDGVFKAVATAGGAAAEAAAKK